MYDQEQDQTNDESTHQLVPAWTVEDLLLLESELMMDDDDAWTKEEELLFQLALVMVPVDMEGRWEKIAERVPGKTAEDVLAYYEALVCEVGDIESGRVELPSYADDVNEKNVVVKKKRGRKPVAGGAPRTRSQKNEKRKKGTPWSEDEHRRFLEGLNQFGKGDWRNISRISVVSRTPTQVASHAQKYFLRLTSGTKERKRSSIHDISIDNTSKVLQQIPPPQPSPLPSPPLANIYDGVEQHLTPQRTSFHGTNTVLQSHPSSPPNLTPSLTTTNFYGGVQQPSTQQPTDFNGNTMVNQPTTSPSPANFYGGIQQPPTPLSTNFNCGQPTSTPSLPSTSIYHGLQQPPTQPPANFNSG